MSEDFSMKPYKIDFIRLVIQYVVGIAVILILAGFIKPPDDLPDFDPFYILRIITIVYDNMILVATMAAEQLVPLVIIALTMVMGQGAYIVVKAVLEKFGGFAITLIEMVNEKRASDEDQEEE